MFGLAKLICIEITSKSYVLYIAHFICILMIAVLILCTIYVWFVSDKKSEECYVVHFEYSSFVTHWNANGFLDKTIYICWGCSTLNKNNTKIDIKTFYANKLQEERKEVIRLLLVNKF